MNQRRVLFILFALAFGLRLFLQLYIHYAADDALITFRYAENVAAGKGFVYNVGERILGTTTPLCTLLIALFLKLGVPAQWSAFFLSQTADLVSAWILLKLFDDAPPVFSWIPAFVFLFSPESLQWSLSGMETEIAIALLLASGYFLWRDRPVAAFAAASFAVLNRIDGVAVLVALVPATVLVKRAVPWKPLGLAALILSPWLLFAFLYFGSPVPNSAIAKMALSGHSIGGAFTEILLNGFLHFKTIGLPLFILAVIGTIHIIRSRRDLLFFPIWTSGYALSYTLAAGPMHPWYYTPFYCGYLVLIFLGWMRFTDRFQWFLRKPAVIAIGAFAVVATLTLSYQRAVYLKNTQEHINGVNQQIGLWLKQNSPPEAVIAIKDIGVIGYYSGRTVLDLAGLVSPQCIPYRARNDFLGPILRFRPDYFAFSAGQARALNLEQSAVLRYYLPVKTITFGQGSYTIYQTENR
jgi:hypothetical protein